jgi:protein TonB
MSPYAVGTAAPVYVRHIGLIIAIVLHGIVLAALLLYAPTRAAIQASAPIMVSYFVPAKPPVPATPAEHPKPLPRQASPKPVAPRAVQPPPVVAVAIDAPAALETPVPDAVTPGPPSGMPTAAAAPTAAPAPAPAAPLPIVPPSFNARYLDNPAPVYPSLARRSGEQGQVLLRVHVTADGAAASVEVHTSSGSARLDQVARETVTRWRFVPARQGDVAVAAWVLVPITFTLEN